MIVKRYCGNCKKDVKCSIATWIDEHTPISWTQGIKVMVEVLCLDCKNLLGAGEEIVKLH